MTLRLIVAGLLLSLAQAAVAQEQRFYNYGPSYYYLTVNATSGGTVTSAPAGISCPGMCLGTYTSGTIALTASAAAGYTFTGWSGACSGTGPCTVSMGMDQSVTANFAASSPTVTPQTGFWYDPAEGARGYVIEQHGNNLFIGGFMYDSGGNAIWYASGPGAMANGTTYTGAWQQYAGGESLTGSFKPAAVSNAMVGSITLQFLTPITATLTLPDGRQIPLQRYPF